MQEQLDYTMKAFEAGSIFTPRSPINERSLFAGRLSQIEKVVDAVAQRGTHAILYGAG